MPSSVLLPIDYKNAPSISSALENPFWLNRPPVTCNNTKEPLHFSRKPRLRFSDNPIFPREYRRWRATFSCRPYARPSFRPSYTLKAKLIYHGKRHRATAQAVHFRPNKKVFSSDKSTTIIANCAICSREWARTNLKLAWWIFESLKRWSEVSICFGQEKILVYLTLKIHGLTSFSGYVTWLDIKSHSYS